MAYSNKIHLTTEQIRESFETQLNIAIDQIGTIKYNVHTADLPNLGSIFYDFYSECGEDEFGKAFCNVLNSRWPDNPLTYVSGKYENLCDLSQFEMKFFGEKFNMTVLLHRIPTFSREEARLIGYSG
jgi:hypothetical protein